MRPHAITITPPDVALTVADAGQGPIKCLVQLGSKRGLNHREEKGTIDECQEDQDGVLGLRGDLIYR